MYSQFHKSNKSIFLNFNKFLIFSALLLVQFVDFGNGGAMINNNPFHHRAELDPDGKYRLEWPTDWTGKIITFSVTAATRGWIGFGLSSKGEISAADIVIGGVRPNGATYLSDRHGVAGNDDELPEVDGSQDWSLLEAWENATHTFLSFSREFDTCDPQDYPITEDKISLIWTFGEDDELLEYHRNPQKWGKYDVYLLTPDYTPPVERDENGAIKRILGVPELESFETWTIPTKLEIPSKDTTYYCTVHTSPKLDKKHHIVGSETRFPTEESRRHVHHIILQKCRVPPELDPSAVFEPLLRNYAGDTCNPQRLGGLPIATQYCREFTWVWAAGGKTFFFPPQFGIPLGESPNEFFLAQVHYNNPSNLSNLTVEANLDFFYTSDLRSNDAGMLLVGNRVQGLPPTILIPPWSRNHHVYAHCSPECTRQMFPESGITILAGWLHAHNSGVGLRLQHFRNDQELPWILADVNFDNSFQQWHALKKEVRVLPGDQLTLECTYDNTWTNSSVVGGLSTREEMCAVVVLYHTKLENIHGHCVSEMRDEEWREFFLGVTNISWSQSHLQYVVSPPHPLAGFPMTQVSDMVEWTAEKREELQRFHLTHPQANLCARSLVRGDNNNSSASSALPFVGRYPLNATPYKPEVAYCPVKIK